MSKERKQVRVTTYVEDEDYRKFRSILARRGETVKGWLRKQIKLLIESEE